MNDGTRPVTPKRPDFPKLAEKKPSPLWAKITVGVFVALFLVIMAGLLVLAAIGVWRAMLG